MSAAVADDVDVKIERVTFGASSNNVADAGDLHRVTGNRVNMRNGPSTSYGVVGSLVRNERVEVLRIENGWAKLRDPNGSVGWMSAKFLKKVEG